MSTFQDKIIETIEKDYNKILELTDQKLIGKEVKLLNVRIKSSQKFFVDNKEMLDRINILQKKILNITSK